MNKISIPLLAIALCLLALPAAAQEVPDTIEDLLLRYHEVKYRGDQENLMYLLHPDLLEQVQDGLLDMAEKFPKEGEEFLKHFSAESVTDLRLMDPLEFVLTLMKQEGGGEGISEGPEVGDVEVLGSVREKDREHFVYRMTIRKGDVELTKVEMLTCKRHQGRYMVLMEDDMEGQLLAMEMEARKDLGE